MCITRDGSRNKAMVSEKKDGGIVLLKEAPGKKMGEQRDVY